MTDHRTRSHIARSILGGRACSARAFTLIELLVVIAILSMLIAIIVVGLNGVRHASKRVACQSNLKNLANAWIEYLDNHDGYFLQGKNTNVTYGGQQGAIPEFQVPKPLNMYVGLPDVEHGAVHDPLQQQPVHGPQKHGSCDAGIHGLDLARFDGLPEDRFECGPVLGIQLGQVEGLAGLFLTDAFGPKIQDDLQVILKFPIQSLTS